MKLAKKYSINSIIISLGLLAMLATVPSAAFAYHGGGHHGHHGGGGHHGHYGPSRHWNHGGYYHRGGAVAGGILFGAAVGMMAGAAMSHPYYYSNCRPVVNYRRYCRIDAYGYRHCYSVRRSYRQCW